jgi:S-adenosylmethionine synthetase
LNVHVPGQLADLTNDRGILLIYISTDYVFDGTNAPYDVRDKANPLNLYGTYNFFLARRTCLAEEGALLLCLFFPVIFR